MAPECNGLWLRHRMDSIFLTTFYTLKHPLKLIIGTPERMSQKGSRQTKLRNQSSLIVTSVLMQMWKSVNNNSHWLQDEEGFSEGWGRGVKERKAKQIENTEIHLSGVRMLSWNCEEALKLMPIQMWAWFCALLDDTQIHWWYKTFMNFNYPVQREHPRMTQSSNRNRLSPKFSMLKMRTVQPSKRREVTADRTG